MISTEISSDVQTQTWRILTTPAWSGEENMTYDLRTIQAVQEGQLPPTLRFFRWSEPTVSYGKHQSPNDLYLKIPADWAAIQRPTGGGMVFHGNDLCFSLCWREGQQPLPVHLKDHYEWIHSVALQAIKPLFEARLARCEDCSTTPDTLATRDCFTQPVGFDILKGDQKILGGALCRQKDTFLYQGSVQGINTPDFEERLQDAFKHALDA